MYDAAHAQIIEGRLTTVADGTPLPSTTVVLATDSNRELARSVTNADGVFRFTVDTDGRYVLRAEVIGFDASPSRDFAATSDGETRLDYGVTLEPVRLTIPSNRAAPCALAPPEMDARAWAETVKALRAVQETGQRGRLSIHARLYQQLSFRNGHVIRETDSIVDDVRETPFVRYAPDVVVGRRGYAIDLADGTSTYEIPELTVFTDAAFEATHCIWLSDRTADGTVSLRFHPRDTTRVEGLVGTFTLDENTAALTRVDLRFAPTSSVDQNAVTTASVLFTHANRADWFIESWTLRTPIVETQQDSRTTTLGYDDIGAHVLDAADTTGQRVWSGDGITVLYGTVFDSLSNAPLQGGVVAVTGTSSWAQTDATGGFALAGYWSGSYGIVFGHPRLDSVGFVSPPHVVELRRGTEAFISLAVPTISSIIGRRCPGLLDARGRKMLIGLVRDDETQQPVPGALVSVARDLIPQEFQGFAIERSNDVAVTDSLGMYTICDIPTGVTLSLAATKGDDQSPFLKATFWEDAVTYGTGGPHPLQYPVGRLDISLQSDTSYSGTLTGTVTDALTGFVMPGVNVTVEGTTRSTSTDSAGVFFLGNLPDGPVRLSLRRLGYQMLRYAIDTEPNDRIVLGPGTLSMVQANSDAVTLDPIQVEAEGVTPKLSEFEDRRSRGFGSFATKKDFDEWNPVFATDVLRRMRGVRVSPNPYYGVNGDTRRLLIEPSRDIGQRVTRVITAGETRGLVSSFGGQDVTISECPMLLFLDGVYLGDSYGTDVDNIISTTDLSAVEVYSPSQVPVQFALPGSTCGVVVFWSY